MKRRFGRVLIKTASDLDFIQKVKTMRFMLWNMLVLDACLYCTREVLHHKLFVILELENFFTILSFCLAVLGLLFCIVETGYIMRYLHRFYYRIDSYILSDLLSSEGVSKLLTQYEVEMATLEPRLLDDNKDITKIRRSIRQLMLKSLISNGSGRQMYLEDVTKAIRIQEDVTLQQYASKRRNGMMSEIELTAIDIYPNLRLSLQPKLDRISKQDRESVSLLPNRPLGNNRDSFADPFKESPDEEEEKRVERSSPQSTVSDKSGTSLLSLEQNLAILNIEKRLLSKYFPFVCNGIVESKLDTILGLVVNLTWLVRFCIINMLIASCQMVPLIQVTIILAVNSVFFYCFVRAYFRVDLYTPGWHRRTALLLEITLQAFFIVTVVFYLNDRFQILSSRVFLALQIICIVMIFSCVICEIVILFSTIGRSLIDLLKTARLRLARWKALWKPTQGLEEASIQPRAVDPRSGSQGSRGYPSDDGSSGKVTGTMLL